MRRRLEVLVVIVVATSALCARAFASASTTPRPAACADLTLTASPPILPPGDPETVSGSVTNCSNQTETVTLSAKVTGPCGFSFSRSFDLTLLPGQTLGQDQTFPAPNREGLYTGRARVVSQGVVLDKAEATFKVCTNCQVR